MARPPSAKDRIQTLSHHPGLVGARLTGSERTLTTPAAPNEDRSADGSRTGGEQGDTHHCEHVVVGSPMSKKRHDESCSEPTHNRADHGSDWNTQEKQDPVRQQQLSHVVVTASASSRPANQVLLEADEVTLPESHLASATVLASLVESHGSRILHEGVKPDRRVARRSSAAFEESHQRAGYPATLD